MELKSENEKQKTAKQEVEKVLKTEEREEKNTKIVGENIGENNLLNKKINFTGFKSIKEPIKEESLIKDLIRDVRKHFTKFILFILIIIFFILLTYTFSINEYNFLARITPLVMIIFFVFFYYLLFKE